MKEEMNKLVKKMPDKVGKEATEDLINRILRHVKGLVADLEHAKQLLKGGKR